MFIKCRFVLTLLHDIYKFLMLFHYTKSIPTTYICMIKREFQGSAGECNPHTNPIDPPGWNAMNPEARAVSLNQWVNSYRISYKCNFFIYYCSKKLKEFNMSIFMFLD